MTSSRCFFFFCDALTAAAAELAPPAVYLQQQRMETNIQDIFWTFELHLDETWLPTCSDVKRMINKQRFQ